MKSKNETKMVTHYSMDSDNILCGYMLRIKAKNLVLISANATEIPNSAKQLETIVVDHSLGIKGDKNMCASMFLFKGLYKKELPIKFNSGSSGVKQRELNPKQIERLEKVCIEINEADTVGFVKSPSFGLASFTPHVKEWFSEWVAKNEVHCETIIDFCNGTKKISLQEILSGIKINRPDSESYQTMCHFYGAIVENINVAKEDFFTVLDGLNHKYKQYGTIKATIETNKPISTKYGNFLFFPKGSPATPLIGIVANEMGYIGVVYKDGYNLGVARYPGRHKPDLNTMKKYIHEQGWFFHPDGFLAARGSRKAKSNSHSKYTPQDLAQILNKI